MKRRGFLGMLLGAPAVPVAAMLEKLPKGFTRGLVESEPEPEVVARTMTAEANECWNYATCVPLSVDLDAFAKNMVETREKIAADVFIRSMK